MPVKRFPRRWRTTLRLMVAALVAATCAATARAQDADNAVFWNLKGGLGISYHLHERNSGERAVLFLPEMVKPLGRHWEYEVEGHFSRFTSPPGYNVIALLVGWRIK